MAATAGAGAGSPAAATAAGGSARCSAARGPDGAPVGADLARSETIGARRSPGALSRGARNLVCETRPGAGSAALSPGNLVRRDTVLLAGDDRESGEFGRRVDWCAQD